MKTRLIKQRFSEQLKTGKPVIIDIFPYIDPSTRKEHLDMIQVRLTQEKNGRLVHYGDFWSKRALEERNWTIGSAINANIIVHHGNSIIEKLVEDDGSKMKIITQKLNQKIAEFAITVKDYFILELASFGMSQLQAEQVMVLAMPKIDSLDPDYKITWHRPFHEYPNALYSSLIPIVKQTAREWVDEIIPEAWFRPMLDDKNA